MTVRRRLVLAAFVAAAAAVVCALAIDAPLALAVADYEAWPGWSRATVVLEYATLFWPWPWAPIGLFVTGIGACLAVRRFRPRLAAWVFVAGSYLTTMNLVGWIKISSGRWCPVDWLSHHLPPMWLGHGQSFPSGHVALIGGLAVPLVVVAPRLAWPVALVIGFTMAARVAVLAHFLSDTFGGLALVCACTALWEPVLRRFASPTSARSSRSS